MSFAIAYCAAKFAVGIAPALLAFEKGEFGEAVVKTCDGLLKGVEAVKDLREPEHKLLSAALAKAAKALEADYKAWRDGEGYSERIESAFALLAEVIARCLPTGETLAKLNHDPDRVAAAVLEAALAIRMDVFADGRTRELLTTWVAATYRRLRAEPKFAETLAGVNWAEIFDRLDRVESKQERFHREQMEALEALRLETARARGVDPEVLRPLFAHLGMEGFTTAELHARAREAVEAILARANAAPVQTNFGPEIDAIIAAARAKLRDLDTAGAEGLLDGQIAEEDAAFRRRQVPLLREKAAVQRLAYNHAGAQATLRRLLALDPDQVSRWIDLGDIALRVGSTAEALAAYRQAQAAARRKGDQRALSVSHNKIGDVSVRQGALPEALAAYRAGLDIAERLARADSDDAEAQRDLSVSYDRIGNVSVRQGALPEALAAYRAGLDIRERLARADPGDAEAQRDLSVSYDQIGDISVRQGALPEALAAYRAGLDIRERLARADSGDARAQHDLIVSCDKIAAVSPDEAQALLSRALDIATQLQAEGRLAPEDDWMQAEFERRLSETRGTRG